MMGKGKIHEYIWLRIIMGLIGFLLALIPILYTIDRSGMMRPQVTMGEQPENTSGEVIRVAAIADYPPYSYLDEEGKPAGYEVELLYMLCNRLGYRPELVMLPRQECMSALKNGEVALITGQDSELLQSENGTVTTQPTCTESYILYGKHRINGIFDIGSARIGYSAGVRMGIAMFNPMNVVLYDSPKAVFDALESQEVDYGLIRSSIGDRLCKTSDTTIRSFEECVCFTSFITYSAREDNAQLIEQLDTELEVMKRDGILGRLQGKWLYDYYQHYTLKETISRNWSTYLGFCLSFMMYLIAMGIIWLVITKNRESRLKEEAAKKQTLEEQLKQIRLLNEELRENRRTLENSKMELELRNKVLNASISVVEGLSSEYDTIWVVHTGDMEMSLYRSEGMLNMYDPVTIALTKCDYETTIDQYVEHYVAPEDRERVHELSRPEMVLTQIEKQGLYNIRYLLKQQDGTKVYHQMSFAKAKTEAGEDGFVLAFRNVDRLIREEIEKRNQLETALEEADRANRAKTSFLFHMSHDIRTPMNAMIGFTNLLDKYQEDGNRRKNYLTKIRHSSEILLSIINNTLEMAKIEKGRLPLQEKPYHLEQLNDALYSMFSEQMNSKQISFERSMKVTHGEVYCDPVKLQEIYLNILSNAYKYTPSGGTITMTIEELSCDQQETAIYRTVITDTGVGMSEEFLPHLFDEFAREKTSTENQLEGTGLGMTIVKKLLEQMEGTIVAESRQGVGTRITVLIPHRFVREPEQEQPGNNEHCTDETKERRILLTEDNDLNAEIATEILQGAGFCVERAEDGAVCVEKIKHHEAGYYDLVLMDIQMPNMNGYEATRCIRELEGVKARIPIVALTANTFAEDKAEAIKSGMNGHLSKPLVITELMQMITGILGSKEGIAI